MKIQKIYPIANYKNYNRASINKHEDTQSSPITYATSPINYGLAFTARVDKGLTRFYEYNKERMPKTVKTYIEKIGDKISTTPLQAQAAAFAALAGLTSIAEIKSEYPDEELFFNLKEAKESRATRGILGTYRENKELFDIDNRSILKNNEDLTVWLVKKIFLEAKTLDEINQDFKSDIDNEFKSFYEDKENSEEPIQPSTLKALGIKLPEAEYQQSLRYTRDGYSDLVGDKISAVLSSIPLKDRPAYAQKHLNRFNQWWASLSHDQKLDMIAKQMDELEMLAEFNASEESKIKNARKSSSKRNKSLAQKADETKIKSDSNFDELFKIWATNNLKIFQAGLSEFDKQIINTKRIQMQADRWNEMSSEEKTAYINRMRTGSEQSRYAAILAWNENPDILVMLSKSLTKDHVEKPTEILYGSEDFNQFLSNSMSYFWDSHPDYAQRFGDSLRAAHSRIKTAVAEGKFEQLKLEIIKGRANRIKDTADEIKNYKAIITDNDYNDYPEYMKEFIDAYSNSEYISLKSLPTQYLKDFYTLTYNSLAPDVIDSWAKHLRGEELSIQDMENLDKVGNAETMASTKLTHAIEAALAAIIYDCTQYSGVYFLHCTQLLTALSQIEKGEKKITLTDNSEKTFSIPVKSNTINSAKLAELYREFSIPLTEYDIDTIIERFFNLDPKQTHNAQAIDHTINFLRTYIDLFGQSSKILFSDENLYPTNIKIAFLQKFKKILPPDIEGEMFINVLDSPEGLVKEDIITNIDGELRKKYSFLPEEMLDIYIYEFNKEIRRLDIKDVSEIKQLYNTSGKNLAMPRLSRRRFNAVHNMYMLCMEQALADALYEATKEKKFYSMSFENLVDYIENFRQYNRFPQFLKNMKADNISELFNIKLMKKVNVYKTSKITKEYTNALTKYLDEAGLQDKKLDSKEILYILNPYENQEEIDMYTSQRIDKIFKYL